MNEKVSSGNEIIFSQLQEEIINSRIKREDPYEIAAFLESIGWNDERARRIFGVADVFELADMCWESLQQRIMAGSFAPVDQNSFWKDFTIAVCSFFRGVIFTLPMLISVTTMLVLRFSLWSYEKLSVDLATCIAIGTILSFITVGGFTQVIARRGFYYIILGYYNMARQITFQFIFSGWFTCALVSASIFLLNVFFHFFTATMVDVILIYYILLSAVWLSTSVMYILKREWLFTLLLVIGIAMVFVMFRLYGMNIIEAQVIALAIVACLATFCIFYLFRQEERKMEADVTPVLTRLSVMVYNIAPYFYYGFLYFVFLFIDRIVAWSTNNINYMPYFIWFRGSYELGLDFALIMLMIPMGFIELELNKMMLRIEAAPKNMMGNETETMNQEFCLSYRRTVGKVMLLSFLCAVLVFFTVIYIDSRQYLHPQLLNNRTTYFVFVVGLVAYALLALGLMNSIMMFSLFNPLDVVKSIQPAIYLDFGVGFVLTRMSAWWGQWITGIDSYAYAVFGLLAGALLFVALTSRHLLRLFKKLDYHLYVAS